MLCDCIFRPYLKNGGFDENEFNVRKKELLDTIDAEINEKRRYAMTRAVRTVYENEPAAIPITAHGRASKASHRRKRMKHTLKC